MAGGTPLGRAFIEVRADLSAFPAELRAKLKAALEEGVAGVEFTELEKAGKKAGEVAGKAASRKLKEETDKGGKEAGRNAAQRFSDSFLGTLGRVSFNKVTLFSSLIAAAAVGIAELAPALYGLAAAAPAALGGLIAGAVVLKLAFHGVGTAIAGALSGQLNAKQLKALEGLAPAARGFVVEIASMRNQLHGLQRDVQQTFFVQFQGTLTSIARNLLPTVRAGLSGLAAGLGQSVRQIGAALSTPFARGATGDFFGAINASARALAPALGALTHAFLALLSTSAPLVQSLGVGLANVVKRFSDWISATQSTGQLSNFFTVAGTVLSAFGTLLGNVLRLFNDLVSGLNQGGPVFVGVLGTLVGLLDQLFASAAGRQLLGVIQQLFVALSNLLIQVLTPLLPVLAQILAAFGGQLVAAITAATPELVHLATTLVPLLQFVADHMDVFGPIALGLLGMAAAIKAYTIAATIAETVTGAFTEAMLAFDIAADANVIGAIVLAIEAIIVGVALLVTHWKQVKKYGSEAWAAIREAAGAVWDWLKSAGTDIADFFTGIGDWFQALPGRILAFLESLPDKIGQLFSAMVHAGFEALGVGIGLLLGEAVQFPGQLLYALNALTYLLGDLLRQGWDNLVIVWDAVTSWLAAEAIALPGQIGHWLSSLPSVIGGVVRSAWDWAKREWSLAADTVVGWAEALPGRIGHFFDNVGHQILGGLRSGINSVIDSFNHGIDEGWHAMLLPGSPFHIPHLAKGAIIDQPTLAVIGEGGSREVVLPTDNLDRARALLEQSGLLSRLREPMPTPVVYVTAMLDSGDLIRVVDARVETVVGREVGSLMSGVRT